LVQGRLGSGEMSTYDGYSKCVNFEPGGARTRVMEQLLREQRTALEKLLAEQQQSVNRLFNDHQKAMQCFLTEAPQQSRPSLTHHPRDTLVKRPEVRAQHGHRRSMSDTSSDGSSDDEERSPHNALTRGVTSAHTMIEPRNAIQRCLLPITQSDYFKGFFSAAIIINTIFLGYRTHVEMRETLGKLQAGCGSEPCTFPNHPAFDGIAKAFFILFTFEMAFRIFAEQAQFCTGPSKFWNLFEMVCLASMAMEQMPVEDSKHMLGNVATLRLFRLLRIFRAARAVRLLQYLKALRLMLYSVVSCIVSMFWAVMLLLMIICLYALYLEDTSLAYLRETQEMLEPGSEYNMTGTELKQAQQVFDETVSDLGDSWNGMAFAVCSLVYSISGGADWGDLAKPFWTIKGGAGVSYMAFVILTIFGLLNILVGIFVQEAEELSKWDKDFVVDGFIQKKKDKEQEISDLFDTMDTEENGVLSLKELSDALEIDAIAAQFAHIQVDVDKVTVLFHVLDVDGNGKISREEFIQGVAKLHGNANATDVADLLIEEQKMNLKMDALKEYISHLFSDLQDKLDSGSHIGGRQSRDGGGPAERQSSGKPGDWNPWQAASTSVTPAPPLAHTPSPLQHSSSNRR